MQLRIRKLGNETLPNGDGDVFCCRDMVEKLGNFFIQEAVVHGIEDFAVHDFFEPFEIDHEAGARIDFAFYRDLQRVVVAVAVRIIAFAENAAVLVRRELRIVIVVRCGEFSFAREIDHVVR